MFPSGRWKGFWEQPGLGREWMQPLDLHFVDGHIHGQGCDCVGLFRFTGTYTPDGKLSLVKQYLGQHQVFYEGHVDGEGTIRGQWSISGIFYGPFMLHPEVDVAELPISEIG